MKTIVKFDSIAQWDMEDPRAFFSYNGGLAATTGLIKRIKYNDAREVLEIVDVAGTIYRKASGKKRGRPKKEQPAT
jgi:hypothetical protein